MWHHWISERCRHESRSVVNLLFTGILNRSILHRAHRLDIRPSRSFWPLSLQRAFQINIKPKTCVNTERSHSEAKPRSAKSERLKTTEENQPDRAKPHGKRRNSELNTEEINKLHWKPRRKSLEKSWMFTFTYSRLKTHISNNTSAHKWAWRHFHLNTKLSSHVWM